MTISRGTHYKISELAHQISLIDINLSDSNTRFNIAPGTNLDLLSFGTQNGVETNKLVSMEVGSKIRNSPYGNDSGLQHKVLTSKANLYLGGVGESDGIDDNRELANLLWIDSDNIAKGYYSAQNNQIIWSFSITTPSSFIEGNLAQINNLGKYVDSGISKQLLLNYINNLRPIWAYQDFAAGSISGTSVQLTANNNGNSAFFDNSKIVQGNLFIIRSDNEDYVYSGTIKLFSSKIEVASINNNSVTLNKAPHSSYPVRIWYNILSSNILPVNYKLPPKVISSSALTALDPILATQEELEAAIAQINSLQINLQGQIDDKQTKIRIINADYSPTESSNIIVKGTNAVNITLPDNESYFEIINYNTNSVNIKSFYKFQNQDGTIINEGGLSSLFGESLTLEIGYKYIIYFTGSNYQVERILLLDKDMDLLSNIDNININLGNIQNQISNKQNKRWSALDGSNAYAAGDIVPFNGALYKNITGNNTTTNPELDDFNWALYISGSSNNGNNSTSSPIKVITQNYSPTSNEIIVVTGNNPNITITLPNNPQDYFEIVNYSTQVANVSGVRFVKKDGSAINNELINPLSGDILQIGTGLKAILFLKDVGYIVEKFDKLAYNNFFFNKIEDTKVEILGFQDFQSASSVNINITENQNGSVGSYKSAFTRDNIVQNSFFVTVKDKPYYPFYNNSNTTSGAGYINIVSSSGGLVTLSEVPNGPFRVWFNYRTNIEDIPNGAILNPVLSHPSIYALGSGSSVGGSVSSSSINVYNNSGIAINKKKVVKITGSSAQASENPTIAVASASSFGIYDEILGFTQDYINNNTSGKVITNGIIEGLNTSEFTLGGKVYLGEDGDITPIEPFGVNPNILIGYVLSVSQFVGKIQMGPKEGVQTSQIHDFNITRSGPNRLLVSNSNNFFEDGFKIGGDSNGEIDFNSLTDSEAKSQISTIYQQKNNFQGKLANAGSGNYFYSKNGSIENINFPLQHDQTLPYKANQPVVKDGKLYFANSDIAANTVFSSGTGAGKFTLYGTGSSSDKGVVWLVNQTRLADNFANLTLKFNSYSNDYVSFSGNEITLKKGLYRIDFSTPSWTGPNGICYFDLYVKGVDGIFRIYGNSTMYGRAYANGNIGSNGDRNIVLDATTTDITIKFYGYSSNLDIYGETVAIERKSIGLIEAIPSFRGNFANLSFLNQAITSPIHQDTASVNTFPSTLTSIDRFVVAPDNMDLYNLIYLTDKWFIASWSLKEVKSTTKDIIIEQDYIFFDFQFKFSETYGLMIKSSNLVDKAIQGTVKTLHKSNPLSEGELSEKKYGWNQLTAGDVGYIALDPTIASLGAYIKEQEFNFRYEVIGEDTIYNYRAICIIGADYNNIQLSVQRT